MVIQYRLGEIIKTYMYQDSPWKFQFHIYQYSHFQNTTNVQCCVQQSERPRTFADWTIALTSFLLFSRRTFAGARFAERSTGWPAEIQNGGPMYSLCFWLQNLSFRLYFYKQWYKAFSIRTKQSILERFVGFK